MTTIAYDGKHIAVDRAISQHAKLPGDKFIRLRDARVLLGCGSINMLQYVASLIERNELFERWPAQQIDNEKNVHAFLVDSKRHTLYGLFEHPVWVRIAPKKQAWGSGAELALGAMYAGADAGKAVRIANKLDRGSGFGVNVFRVAR